VRNRVEEGPPESEVTLPTEQDRSSTLAIISVLSFAGVAVAVVQTLLVPIIPELPSLLGVSADDASWLITATLIGSVVATTSLSRLADMFGKRRMLLVSLGCLLVGSLIAVVGTSLVVLIIARVLQGFAIALVPIGMSIMRDELPRERLAGAVALMSATIGIGAAVGLPLSGWIYSQFGWHAIFWMSAAVALGMIISVVIVVPESPVRSGGRFDYAGAILLSLALTTVLLGITKGGTWGWGSTPTLGSFVIGIALFAAWWPLEFRAADPVVDLRTSMRRPVALTNAASLFLGFAMYANLLTTTQLLQLPKSTGFGFGVSPLAAGLALLPAALAMVILTPVSARITKRFGARSTLMSGSLILLVGFVGRSFVMGTELLVVLGAVIVSGGTAFAYSSLPVLIMRAVPMHETAAANGLNTVVRMVGTAISSATVAALLTGMLMAVGDQLFPSEAAFRTIFLCAGAGALIAFIIAIYIPDRVTDQPDQADIIDGSEPSRR
jgi:MFS family permease